MADVAEYCVLALEDERMRNRDVPLGGPAAVPPNEVVAIFEKVAGSPFKVKRIPAAVLRIMSPLIALFNEKQASGMALGAQAADGDVVESALQQTLPVKLTTIEEYAQRVAGRTD